MVDDTYNCNCWCFISITCIAWCIRFLHSQVKKKVLKNYSSFYDAIIISFIQSKFTQAQG